MTVRVRQKGQITIPAEVREAVQLDEGAELDVAVNGHDEIVLRLVEAATGVNGATSPAFSEELQARLERALADVDAGNVTIYEDDESFFNSLT
ncbi:MAG: AbrB/MazE/SpoVT family DNA-binding domain-containing protein [Gaiellaceae bacterium]